MSRMCFLKVQQQKHPFKGPEKKIKISFATYFHGFRCQNLMGVTKMLLLCRIWSLNNISVRILDNLRAHLFILTISEQYKVSERMNCDSL